MPDTDNKRSYKSLLIRYGTIFQGLQELKNQRYSPLRWKPQADHKKIYQIAENLWKSTIFGGFAFYLLPQIGAIYCNIQCARREQDF